MKIMRSGSQPSTLAPEEHYTGMVRLDAPYEGEGASKILGRTVTFEPGARTD
jgi:quercetin dioxygenase-like cupin family protein